MVNKRVWNAVLGCYLKNDIMASVHFQGKPFNITVIQVYAPTSNTEEAEDEQFYEDWQDLLEWTPQKWCPFHYKGLECKSRMSKNTPSLGVNQSHLLILWITVHLKSQIKKKLNPLFEFQIHKANIAKGFK